MDHSCAVGDGSERHTEFGWQANLESTTDREEPCGQGLDIVYPAAHQDAPIFLVEAGPWRQQVAAERRECGLESDVAPPACGNVRESAVDEVLDIETDRRLERRSRPPGRFDAVDPEEPVVLPPSTVIGQVPDVVAAQESVRPNRPLARCPHDIPLAQLEFAPLLDRRSDLGDQ